MVAAVRVHKAGGPEVLTFEQADIPAPGANQIRIKQAAAGINYIDTYFRTGAYPPPNGYPLILGNEGSGDVIAVGPGVTDFKVGDRVTAVFAHRRLRGRAEYPGRPRREAASQHHARAGRRHDAQGHDGANTCCAGPST